MIKVLLVEDEIIALNGIAALIEGSDLPCQVVGVAEDGYIGMHKAKTFMPDIVITDIKMPRIDGLTMIKNISSWGAAPQVVVLSSYSDFEFAQKAIRYGVHDYLLKPVTAEELLGTLARICNMLLGSPSDISLSQLPDDGSVGGYLPIVESMIAYIRENYNCAASIQDISATLRITPAYASSLFSKATGKTFTDYLRDVRLAHAKRLLLSTDDKIYEIAYKVGYNDDKYFCRLFKTHTGVSAKKFAQKQAEHRAPDTVET